MNTYVRVCIYIYTYLLTYECPWKGETGLSQLFPFIIQIREAKNIHRNYVSASSILCLKPREEVKHVKAQATDIHRVAINTTFHKQFI